MSPVVVWHVSAQGHYWRGTVLVYLPLCQYLLSCIRCTFTPRAMNGFPFMSDQVLTCLLEFILPEAFLTVHHQQYTMTSHPSALKSSLPLQDLLKKFKHWTLYAWCFWWLVTSVSVVMQTDLCCTFRVLEVSDQHSSVSFSLKGVFLWSCLGFFHSSENWVVFLHLLLFCSFLWIALISV